VKWTLAHSGAGGTTTHRRPRHEARTQIAASVVLFVALISAIAAKVGGGDSTPAATPAPATPAKTDRCLDVPKPLRVALKNEVKRHGFRVGVMQAVKSDEAWTSETGYWVDVPIYWVAAEVGKEGCS
jgi:hypothetical protein